MKKIFLASALLASSLACGLATATATAAQILFQGSPTESTTAIVSRTEPNLITINGRKIVRIYGAEGMFTVTPEPETGSAWLKPISDKPLMTVFITDEDGQHYKILLKVQDIPAETIIVKGATRQPSLGTNKKAEPHNDDILNMVNSLYGGAGDEKHQKIPLWKGTKFELVRTIELRDMLGETYLLTNTTDKPVIMDEREFNRDGVEAVVITNPDLEAGQSTEIFVVNEAAQ